MEIHTPTPEALEEFREVGRKASMEFLEGEYGEEGVEMAEKYLEAIEQAVEEED
jgi:hypothetical protein